MSASHARSDAATNEETREIVASRVFDAPRDLVFKMWTDREHAGKWWGPKGFRTTIHEMDVRPGGVWQFVMHGPDGTDYNNKIIYREIVRPERLVYSHVSGPTFDSTVTFTAEGKDRTRVDVVMVFPTAEIRNKTAKDFGAIEGLHQHLERLGDELARARSASPADAPFVISRTFNAPRDLMFRIWTEAEHLQNWFGPKGAKIFAAKNDLRPGGVFHFGMRAADGTEIWGRWVYREISRPERYVFVSSFSDKSGGLTTHPMSPDWPLEILSTITFAEHGGKTTVTVEWTPINPTEAERNAFNAGRASMKAGWGGTFENLEAYVPAKA